MGAQLPIINHNIMMYLYLYHTKTIVVGIEIIEIAQGFQKKLEDYMICQLFDMGQFG